MRWRPAFIKVEIMTTPIGDMPELRSPMPAAANSEGATNSQPATTITVQGRVGDGRSASSAIDKKLTLWVSSACGRPAGRVGLSNEVVIPGKSLIGDKIIRWIR